MSSEFHLDPRNDKFDYSEFSIKEDNPRVLYGLPNKVSFCAKCGVSNQRPNSAVEYQHTKTSRKNTIAFDGQGICDACHAAEQKNSGLIDWNERRRELMDLCNKYRSKDGSYDCIVPGSGGKDSFYQSWMLKYEFGMNPLTITWAPHLYTDWGWRNFNRWIHSGFDNHLVTPNGRVKRLLTRLSLENLFHPFQPFFFGQKSLAPKIAANLNIPLVFYGENEAEYGNPIASNASPKQDFAYFSCNSDSDIYLGGTSLADLKENYDVSESDLSLYKPANPDLLDECGVVVHYLGYYLKWHPQGAYYFAVENGGFEPSPERTPGTYSKYNSIDDKIDDLHFYTYYIKFGMGRTFYDACQEVRSGDLERKEAVSLIKRYDGEFPERFADELMRYLSLPEKEFPVASKMFESSVIDRRYFDALSNRFRSPHLWAFDNEKWILRNTVI